MPCEKFKNSVSDQVLTNLSWSDQKYPFEQAVSFWLDSQKERLSRWSRDVRRLDHLKMLADRLKMLSVSGEGGGAHKKLRRSRRKGQLGHPRTTSERRESSVWSLKGR